MIVVIDTNVFLSALGSRAGDSWRCFVLLARREFQCAVTAQILLEYETTAARLALRSGIYQNVNWRSLFSWIRDSGVYFEPAPLGKQRSRDADDDIFLACALASGAKIIVSHDKDLLALKKPFGIEIIKPSVFISRFK